MPVHMCGMLLVGLSLRTAVVEMLLEYGAFVHGAIQTTCGARVNGAAYTTYGAEYHGVVNLRCGPGSSTYENTTVPWYMAPCYQSSTPCGWTPC
jgi:hypothetical protein